MSEERLDSAIRALRSVTSQHSRAPDETEDAIVRRVARTSRSRRAVSGLRLGALIVLGSSTVWAVSGPVRSQLSAWLDPDEEIGVPVQEAKPIAPKTKSQMTPARPNPPQDSLGESEAWPSSSEVEQVRQAHKNAERHRAPEVLPNLEPTAQEIEASSPESMAAELKLYRAAHEAHFRGAASARALALWDGYLVAYPSGTFAPEARFNRAVCLARLGRKAEARLELQPFASRPGYRQREAQELVKTLD